MISNDLIDKKLFLMNAGQKILESGDGANWCDYELKLACSKLRVGGRFTPEEVLRLKQVVWYIEKFHIKK